MCYISCGAAQFRLASGHRDVARKHVATVSINKSIYLQPRDIDMLYSLRPNLRDRSNLLGVTPPSSGRSSPHPPNTYQPAGQRYADDLEGQNDEALEGLSLKVKQLKEANLIVFGSLGFANLHTLQITKEIGNITRESTQQLSEMVRKSYMYPVE